MKRFGTTLLLVVVASVSFPSLADAQSKCIVPKAGAGQYGHCEDCDRYEINVEISMEYPDDPDAQQARRELLSAVTAWNDCLRDGLDGPYINVNGRGSGRPNINIEIDFMAEARYAHTCGINDGVANIPGGASIKIFTNRPAGCANWYTIGMHELGHALGLEDSECTGLLMSGSPVNHTSIPANECAAIAEMWRNPGEPEERERIGEDQEPSSPLVLDMDDNGIATSSVYFDPVLFDLNNDGLVERAGWTAPGTNNSFLWLDLNGDGIPNDGGELFGDSTVLPGNVIASNGIDALAVYDSDGDKKITRTDPIWSELMLWTDRDHSATAEPKELQHLASSAVVGISLDASPRVWTDENGNFHSHMSVYWTQDQNKRFQRHLIEDIWFLIQPISTDPRR